MNLILSSLYKICTINCLHVYLHVHGCKVVVLKVLVECGNNGRFAAISSNNLKQSRQIYPKKMYCEATVDWANFTVEFNCEILTRKMHSRQIIRLQIDLTTKIKRRENVPKLIIFSVKIFSVYGVLQFRR